MERSTSSKVDIPPSERTATPRASYTDSTSPALSPAEREALLALWAGRPDTIARPIGDLDVAILNRRVSRRTLSSSSGTRNEVRARTPLTAPVFQSKPVDIPAGPKTEPKLPSFVTAPKSNMITPSPSTYSSIQQPMSVANGLPTPAASDVGSWSTRSAHSPLTTPFIPASPHLPVSSWNSSTDTSPESTHKCTCRHGKRPSRMTRLKSALKDLFHPVDDSDLEHIETSHWTEQ